VCRATVWLQKLSVSNRNRQLLICVESISLFSLERGGLPTDYSMRTRGTVQTGYPGVYTVEYRVTFTDRDEKNPDFDRKYTGYSKLIVVVEG